MITCEHCIYFEWQTIGVGTYGLCHRYPPQYSSPLLKEILDMYEDPNEELSDMHLHAACIKPIVHNDDRACGEFVLNPKKEHNDE